MLRIAVLAVATLALGACKGDRNKCEQACRNYGTLMYWEKADKDIAAAPEAERDQLKKEKLAQFSHHLESGVDTCVNQCASANNDEQIDCMIAAKKADEVAKCSSKDD